MAIPPSPTYSNIHRDPGTMRLRCIAVFALLMSALPAAYSAAQSADRPGMCVLVYLDSNYNDAREPGETILPGVGVDFSTRDKVVMANRASAEQPVCVTSLQSGVEYQLTLSGSSYRTVASAPYIFTAGSTLLTREIAAEPTIPDALTAGPLEVPLSRPVRLALSIGAALVAMLTCAGVGLLLYGLFFRVPAVPKINRKVRAAK